MRRPPPLPSLVVLAAVATMIGLGLWQLQRARWKDGVIAEARAAASQPPAPWPAVPTEADAPLFRRSRLVCLSVDGWRATSGRNRLGEPGWIHIAACRTGAGARAQVVTGWSTDSRPPAWNGGAVAGVIAPDTVHVIRLVADDAPPGLRPAAPPGVDDIPNNHRAYAVQWFLFAVIALGIYALVLRRRGQR